MFEGIQAGASNRSATEPKSPRGAEQRVGAFTMLPALIRQLGANPTELMDAADLPSSAVDDPENRISYAALGRLLHWAAAVTGCEHFGLLAGRVWHLSDLGLVGELTRNALTVREGLQKFVSYQHLNSESAVAFLREEADVVEFGCAMYGDSLEGVAQLCDAYLAAGVNFLRELCGPGWAPTEVYFPHAGPSNHTYHRQCFKVHPRFNAEYCALRFPAFWMDRPVEAADAERLRAAGQLARTRRSRPLVQEVQRTLRILLLSGKSSGDDVARVLSMHRRTLNRRLREQGTTFQTILDEVRFRVACQLLGASAICLDDVAAALAYAGVSPFMRSFRRWTGTTPGRWRDRNRRSECVIADRSFDGPSPRIAVASAVARSHLGHETLC